MSKFDWVSISPLWIIIIFLVPLNCRKIMFFTIEMAALQQKACVFEYPKMNVVVMVQCAFRTEFSIDSSHCESI